MPPMKHALDLGRKAVSAYIDDYAPSMGAAIAYYTMFSLAPLLVIVIAVAGTIFGAEAVQGQIVAQIGGLIGNEGALFVQRLVRSASDTGKGLVASLVSLGVLVIGATTVFAELQHALDRIWHVPKSQTPSGIWALLRALALFRVDPGACLSADGVTRGQHGRGCLGQMDPGSDAGVGGDVAEPQHDRIRVHFNRAVHDDLQADAIHAHCLARRVDRWPGNRRAVRGGQVADRAVSGQERHDRILRRCRLAGGSTGLGVLRGADLFAGRSVYQGLCG